MAERKVERKVVTDLEKRGYDPSAIVADRNSGSAGSGTGGSQSSPTSGGQQGDSGSDASRK